MLAFDMWLQCSVEPKLLQSILQFIVKIILVEYKYFLMKPLVTLPPRAVESVRTSSLEPASSRIFSFVNRTPLDKYATASSGATPNTPCRNPSKFPCL